ncbi:MAG: DUF533 domain-containing protein [Myxococcota bacterium]
MKEAPRAMATWIGTLARGGVLRSVTEEAGVAVAAYVVGEDRLSELRQFMSHQPPEVVKREQKAAIDACIWMAQADRKLDSTERELLERMVDASGLDYATQEALVASIDAPSSIEDVEQQLQHPVLRELLLALAWELALVDGRVAEGEKDFYTGLAERLSIEPARAEAIKRAVSDQVLE